MSEKNGFIKLFIAVLILSLLGNCSGGEDCDDYGHDRFQAWVDAKHVVEKRLKAPSTAEFCDFSDGSVSQDDNTWTVRGTVDAQNGFGAYIRADYVVKITYVDETPYRID